MFLEKQKWLLLANKKLLFSASPRYDPR